MALRILGLVLVLQLLRFTEASTDHLNYGISFQEMGPIKFSADVWKHSFLIGLPTDLELPLLQYCSSSSKTCMGKNSIVSNINAVRRGLVSNFNNTFMLIQELLPNTVIPSNESRRKKALFGFLGSIAHSLFGVSTDDQLQQITNQMNILKKAMAGANNVMAQNNKEFASYVKTMDDRINNLMQGIRQNSIISEQLTDELHASTKSLEQFMTATSAALANEIAGASYVSQKLDTLRQAITDLAEGQLSPSLIQPKMLSDTIGEIQDMLIKQYPSYKLATTNVMYYYRETSFTVIRQEYNILITIDFPIASTDNFKLYKVFSFPIPVNDTSAHATHLTHTPDYMAITEDKQFYTTLSKDAVSYCKSSVREKYCNFRPPLSAVSKQNCIANLFLNNRQEVKENCNFRFLTDELHPHILHISDNKIIIYQMSKLILECPNNRRRILPGCNFCLMEIPCSCILLTSDIIFQSPLTQCGNQTNTVNKVFPINLSLIQHFFNDSQLAKVLANTTYDKYMSVIIPKLKIYKHKMSGILAKDQKYDLSLQKIAEKVKNSSTIYNSITDAYLDGQFTFDEGDIIDIRLVLSIAGLVLTGINLLTIIYLFRKVQMLSTIVVMARSTSVRSTSPNFHFSATQSPQNNINNEHESPVLSVLKWEHAIFAICTFTLLLLILLSFHQMMKRKGDFTLIMLEVTNGAECEIVKILQLPACPDFYDIQTPTSISQLAIKGIIRPHLAVQWPDFTVTDRASGKYIQANERLSVSWLSAYKLNRILQTPFLVHIAIRHHNALYVLDTNNDGPSIPTAPPNYVETPRQTTHM